MNVAMIGTGYVGLVTGACLADVGNNVACVDIDANKISRLACGEIPIYEPGLEQVVRRNIQANRLQFTTSIDAALRNSQVVFIAVGTPSNEDGSADIDHVLECARSIGEQLIDEVLVVVKSTVPVGTNAAVRRVLQERFAARNLSVRVRTASNPEFLKEGMAVEDFMKPDRIIFGVDSDDDADLLRRLYVPFNRSRDRVLVMEPRAAEFTKYAANCMLAVRISFMNELANVAERLGVDIEQVRHGIGSDNRIGPHFLYPGVGFGGSCFPKDLRAMVHMAREASAAAEVLEAAIRANEKQQSLLAAKISRFFRGNVSGKRVALWGLAFKANTDDVREAPSIRFAEELSRSGAFIKAYDPVATQAATERLRGLPRIEFAGSAMEALEGADVLAVTTEWLEFRSPDFASISGMLREKAVFDGRNLYETATLEAAGLAHFGIGRGLPL
jgi:UDPglucose 6-dehydrogenase